MAEETRAEIIVIGAGIAGASVAAMLSEHVSVTLLEMESQPGYHSTGRSAAVFAPTYGPQPIRALTRASEAFFRKPPKGFSAHDILTPRGALFVARRDQLPAMKAAYSELNREGDLIQLDAEEARSKQPLLREGYAAGGIFDSNCADIDVQALHQGYLRQFRANRGQLVTRAEVTAIERMAGSWRVTSAAGSYYAPKLVNAAGAWADRVGVLARAATIGLVPKRRTALIIQAPEGVRPDGAPVVIDIDEQFYLKPDAGRLLISPANEDPDVPSDVQPDEMDVAICIDRIEKAFALQVRRVESRWAGLRSFVADKAPVVGFSRHAEEFFWLAGQGGYGIQSSPALSRLAAAMVLGEAVPADILAEGLDLAAISPERMGA